ncbi:MAG TPA: glycosyltransferase family 4 protein [Abditibacteriaceae bacterium]|jgi:glycosyltransferase involved in cell wall biosynthesis
MKETKPRLIVAFTHAKSSVLLRGQLADAKRRGYDVTALVGPGADKFVQSEGVKYVAVSMERQVALLHDAISLWKLVRAIRRLRPHIVNAGTPKAGLLVTLAAAICGVPCRIYTLRGLRLETTTGKRRKLLLRVEKTICRLAHRVVCISPSLRDRAVEIGIVSSEKAVVLGSGSSNGFDIKHYRLSDELRARGMEIRTQNGIAQNGLVIGFVGRIVQDKGVSELLQAWRALRTDYPQLKLLFVGEFDEGTISDADRRAVEQETMHIDHTPDVRPYIAAMDIVVLPSYREGFGNVLAEASAMEKPVIATDIPGCRDAVAAEVSGILVPPQDTEALIQALRRYLDNPTFRELHGKQGRERIIGEFRQDLVWDALDGLYQNLLRSKSLPLPRAQDE